MDSISATSGKSFRFQTSFCHARELRDVLLERVLIRQSGETDGYWLPIRNNDGENRVVPHSRPTSSANGLALPCGRQRASALRASKS